MQDDGWQVSDCTAEALKVIPLLLPKPTHPILQLQISQCWYE